MVFPFLVPLFIRLNGAGKAIVVLLFFIDYLVITFYIVPVVTLTAELPFAKINPASYSINVAYQFGFLRFMCGAYGSNSINKVFSTKALQKLGDLSFTIYLVHQPLLYTIGSINSYLHPAIQNSIAAGPPPKPAMLFDWLVWR
jgi:hypothetical protein